MEWLAFSAILIGLAIVLSAISLKSVLAVLTTGFLVSNLGPVAHAGWTPIMGQTLAEICAYAAGGAALMKVARRRMSIRFLITVLLLYSVTILLISNLLSGTLSAAGWGYWIASLCLLLFGATVRVDFQWNEFRPSAITISATSLLMLWLQVYSGQVFSRFFESDGLWDSRGLQAAGALLIGLVLVAQCWGFKLFPNTTANLGAALANIAALITLQQRTVWIATLVGLLVCVLSNGSTLRRRLNGLHPSIFLRMAAALSALALVLLSAQAVQWIVSGYAHSTTPSISAPHTEQGQASPEVPDAQLGLEDSLSDFRNLLWRVSVWSSYLSADHEPTDFIFGVPSTTQWVEGWSPHSLMLENVRRIGILGTGIVLALVTASLTVRNRTTSQRIVGQIAAPPLLVVGITYEPPSYMFLLVGIALSLNGVQELDSETAST